MDETSKRRSVTLIKLLASVVAILGIAAIFRGALVLSGEPVASGYKAHLLAGIYSRIGSVPTAVLCAVAGVLLMLFAVRIWRSESGTLRPNP